MQLPEALLNSLEHTTGFDKEAFIKVHTSPKQVTSIRINKSKLSESEVPSFGGDLGEVVSWTEYGYYLNQRPSFTFDPLFHAGTYYVQEASSMFIEQALKQMVDLTRPLKVLDLCAAPGGKSTHIQSLISGDSLLVSNEVIRARANVLKDNIVKWGSQNVMVTNNDPSHFARLKNYFDVIVIDAPCSGSGLFRRDEEATREWSENNVQLCSQRQQRILADVWPALKKDGVLIYSTCSYSQQEDEEIMDWINGQLSSANCQLSIISDWKIIKTISANGNTGYRFWPDKVKGEGFFIACFRKTEGEESSSTRTKNKPESLSKVETIAVEKWMKTDGFQLIKHLNKVYAWPVHLADEFNFLLNNLHVIYSGTIIGELMRNKLVPDHALAMSGLVNESIPKVELNKEQAILYLQRKELKSDMIHTGWHLVTYHAHNLGWVNILPNRVNNYYPKELRILKDK